jgi:hypothetical protein
MNSRALLLAALAGLAAACSSDGSPAIDAWSPHDGLHDFNFFVDGPPGDGAPDAADAAPAEDSQKQPSHEQLAAHWAPVWYQDSDSSNYEGDYIVAYDFDGDTRSDNNWDNLDKAGVDLRAVIYWSLVETQTHWFILYADFHPQDWDENCQPIPFGPDKCHENDMEGAMVVVEKDGSPHGKFFLLYTEAHNILYIFTNDPSVKPSSSKSLKSVPVTFEEGSHPELYVESKGHGVCALQYDGSDHCSHPLGSNPFPGGDGVVYRYKGKAEKPSSGDDRDVGYDLVPLSSTLWPRREDICNDGCTFDGEMVYEGMTLGKAFDGDSHGDDKANPPWAWDDPDDGPVYRGDFFFRPAESAVTHLQIIGAWSKTYLHNPFVQGK